MAAKVLIAHGDKHALERAVRDLTVAGYEVVATPDGGDAFARFFEVQPSLVVASERLPVLDGRSFAEMIRSQAPGTPVVLLTADGVSDPTDDTLTLPEPLDVHALEALVPQVVTAGAPMHDEWGPAPPPDDEEEEGTELRETLQGFRKQGNLLALLDDTGVERLAHAAALQHRQADEQVIREGDVCNGFYLVVDGEVRVTLAERGDQEVARLGIGEFFGEMSLLSDQPRSASVWTAGSSDLIFFEKDAVLPLLDDYPELRELLGGVALQRAETNLFDALTEDDEVQNSLSDLLEGIGDDEGGGMADALEPPTRPPVAAEVPTVADTGPKPSARQRSKQWQSQAFGAWHSLRLWTLRHQLETGLAIGTVGGMALMALLMALFSSPSQSVPVLNSDVSVTKPALPEPPLPFDPPGSAGKEAAAPKPGADPTPAGDEGAVAPDTAGDEADPGPPPKPRKAMRKTLIAAYQAKAYRAAVNAGERMRVYYELDWEAEFTLAQAYRRAGDIDAALDAYAAFSEAYPSNVYADDADFWAAELLSARGETDAAAALYQRVIDNPKTNLKARAAKRLAEVRR